MTPANRQPPASPAPASPVPGKGRMLNIKDVIRETSLSRTTIWRLIKAGRFPPNHLSGRKAKRWFERDIEEWKHTLD